MNRQDSLRDQKGLMNTVFLNETPTFSCIPLGSYRNFLLFFSPVPQWFSFYFCYKGCDGSGGEPAGYISARIM